MNMKILIIEDEKIAADSLEKCINELEPSFEIIDKISTVRDAIKWLSNNTCDLIFLDIHLADDISFKIFDSIEVKTPIIFTTAYDQYAIQAFELNSISYLLKPINNKALAKAIYKFKELNSNIIQSPDTLTRIFEQLSSKETNFQKRFMVYAGSKVKTIKIEEIAYFYIIEKSTFLCTYNGKNYAIDYSLDKLEPIIDPTNFFRINRQFIIHIDAISAMHPLSNSRMKIDLNPPSHTEAIVSLHRYGNFKRWLNQ